MYRHDLQHLYIPRPAPTRSAGISVSEAPHEDLSPRRGLVHVDRRSTNTPSSTCCNKKGTEIRHGNLLASGDVTKSERLTSSQKAGVVSIITKRYLLRVTLAFKTLRLCNRMTKAGVYLKEKISGTTGRQRMASCREKLILNAAVMVVKLNMEALTDMIPVSGEMRLMEFPHSSRDISETKKHLNVEQFDPEL